MKTTYIYIILVVLVVGGLVLVRNTSGGKAAQVTKLDDFGQCLTNSGAKFYGAYWCPHCADQKKILEKSTKIPYVECSTPDGKAQTQICIDEKIEGYPTWKFANGEVVAQVMSLEELSEKTGCSLPQS